MTQHLRGTKSWFSLDSEMFALSFYFYFPKGHSSKSHDLVFFSYLHASPKEAATSLSAPSIIFNSQKI